MNLYVKWLLLPALFFALIALKPATAQEQEAPQPVPKGDRILAMDVNGAGDSYEAAFKQAKSVGIQAVTLNLNWDEQELSPGKYQTEPSWLKVANEFYPPRQTAVILILRPVDTNGPHLPLDLKGKRWNDPDVISRFNLWVDHVFESIPNLDVTVLGIGNEIDLGLGDNQWEDYAQFYQEVVTHAMHKRARLKVGTVATVEGLLRRRRSELQNINQRSDYILATYYPLQPDYAIKSPAAIEEELEQLLDLASDRMIFFTEMGCPSSPSVGSSLQRQAEFINDIFYWWDANAGHVAGISFSCFANRSPSEASQLSEYYRVESKPFSDFLQSLGLCYLDQFFKPKPAFGVLRQKALERGWVSDKP